MTAAHRHILTLALLTGGFIGQLHSQGVQCSEEESNGDFTLGVELVAENIGPVVDFNGATTDLSGYNTYRVYLNTEGPLDKLSAVYGDDDRPLSSALWTGNALGLWAGPLRDHLPLGHQSRRRCCHWRFAHPPFRFRQLL